MVKGVIAMSHVVVHVLLCFHCKQTLYLSRNCTEALQVSNTKRLLDLL